MVLDKASEQGKKTTRGSSSWDFWERLNLHRHVRACRRVGGGCPKSQLIWLYALNFPSPFRTKLDSGLLWAFREVRCG